MNKSVSSNLDRFLLNMDFKFLQNSVTGKWIISAPRRAKRPDDTFGNAQYHPERSRIDDLHKANVCPFCPGMEKNEKEVYRVGGADEDRNWQIRVVPNKYPFAPIHEVIIHSPDHHKNFGELDEEQSRLVFQTFRQRYNTHKTQGQVYIFHNRGEQAGESLTHPHSQLAVIPDNVHLDIPSLDLEPAIERIETTYFYIFCPSTSEWPDEVWLTPKSKIKNQISKVRFGDITDEEITDLSKILSKLVQIFQKKLGTEFPYNFYIYPGKTWYLRFIPRVRILGGFEVGTNVSVNTQDPKGTLKFIKDQFQTPL